MARFLHRRTGLPDGRNPCENCIFRRGCQESMPSSRWLYTVPSYGARRLHVYDWYCMGGGGISFARSATERRREACGRCPLCWDSSGGFGAPVSKPLGRGGRARAKRIDCPGWWPLCSCRNTQPAELRQRLVWAVVSRCESWCSWQVQPRSSWGPLAGEDSARFVHGVVIFVGHEVPLPSMHGTIHLIIPCSCQGLVMALALMYLCALQDIVCNALEHRTMHRTSKTSAEQEAGRNAFNAMIDQDVDPFDDF